ncbi:MAG: 3-isopropylmalate dehydratase, partial [Deltaproteobacteria bacterium]|nr:3-isopropylmalate dehydratase [Deltaproteobacteria bacterium]
ENRMGDGSFAHLSSGAMVAASARTMQITDPRPLLAKVDRAKFEAILGKRQPRRTPEIQVIEPQPHVVEGHAQPASAKVARDETKAQLAATSLIGKVQRFGDNIDTDAIIPGQFCHLTSTQDLGDKAFHFVRPDFTSKARAGANIVVAGEAWGSGSSREQAVLALKGADIKCVIAKSYAFIHKRNLVNEAVPFLVVKDAAFYEAAGEGVELSIDLAHGKITVGGATFAAESPSKIIQSLAGEGGIVPAIQHHGTSVFDKLTA